MWFKGRTESPAKLIFVEKLESPQARYDQLIGSSLLFRSDARATIAINSNNMAFKNCIDAANLAKTEGLGEEQVKRAARMGYEATLQAGQIASDLGLTSIAVTSFSNAIAVSIAFGLARELTNKAALAQSKISTAPLRK
jgi:hypothetical protein